MYKTNKKRTHKLIDVMIQEIGYNEDTYLCFYVFRGTKIQNRPKLPRLCLNNVCLCFIIGLLVETQKSFESPENFVQKVLALHVIPFFLHFPNQTQTLL